MYVTYTTESAACVFKRVSFASIGCRVTELYVVPSHSPVHFGQQLRLQAIMSAYHRCHFS